MEDSKEYILKTAYSLFLQKSYKAVTLKELMDKTNLSKGAFYHHFTSKEHLFDEIINHYFTAFTHVDFSQFSQSSLADFIQDHLKYNLKVSVGLRALNEGDDSDTNRYALVFEALRILPDFKRNMLTQLQVEEEAWKTIIKTAKQNGEIRGDLSKTKLARLFISVSDGTALKLIMQNNTKLMNEKTAEAWTNLYALIKV